MAFRWNESRGQLQFTLDCINATRGKGKLRDIRASMVNSHEGIASIELQFGKMERKFRISEDGRKVTFCGTTRLIKGNEQ